MKTILIVDDEPVSLLMTNHIISSEYRTVCAESGQEAVELFKKRKIDMVLSDVRMPGMSGYELQQTLSALSEQPVPFMLMTADSADETESKGFENGALDFIRKPFRADILLSRVRNILHTVDQIDGLTRAAYTDPMTGLLNKAASVERISELCKSAQGVLMMIDLDSFKLVNDLYGHDMGDKILIRFAEILQAVVRESDVVGRLGGDEFIAFCRNVEEEVVIEKKSRFINKIILESAKDFMGENMQIPIGASIGCVRVSGHGGDYAELCRKADKALLMVKRNGKHGFLFHTDGDVAGGERSEVDMSAGVAGMVKILSERNVKAGAFMLSFEQFRLLYQYTERVASHDGKKASLIVFSLTAASDAATDADAVAENFLSVLQTSLRRSDAVCQSSRLQFLALLSDAEFSISENRHSVLRRIEAKWEEDPASKEYTIASEYTAFGGCTFEGGMI